MTPTDTETVIATLTRRIPLNVSFWVPGVPVAQPRPRAVVRAGLAGVYNPPDADKWKKEVRFRCSGAIIGGNVKPTSAPLHVTLTFDMPGGEKMFKKDGSHSAEGRRHEWENDIYHTQKPDIDNLAKAVLDALNPIQTPFGLQRFLWDDDAQICSLQVTRNWSTEPGVRVEVVTP